MPTPHGAAPMNATVLQLVAASAGLSAADVARVAALQVTHEAELAMRTAHLNDDDEHSV